MKRYLSLLAILSLVFTLLAAPSHPEFLPSVEFVMSDTYSSGSSIQISVRNNTSSDVNFLEQGQCHRFFKLFDQYGNRLDISDPNMACTMEFRSTRVAAGETKVIDTWNQRVYGTCPVCTTEPCPLMEAYPRWCEENPYQVPDGQYEATASYTTNSNLDSSEAVTITQSFSIGSGTPSKFVDVSSSYWAYEYIMYLYNNGIAQGYGDGHFRPDWNITKAEMVKMALNAANIPLNTYIQAPTPYKDVTPSHTLVYYIATAKSRGLIPDGDYFYPQKTATRFFTLQLLIDALGKTPDFEVYSAQPQAFSDSSTKEERAYTTYAEEQGIVSGYGDGTYGPNDPVRRSEMAKIIHNTVTN